MSDIEFPQVPIMLGRKTYPRNNILVGSDKAQIRFAEQVLGIDCVEVQKITDEDVLGHEEHLLLRVSSSHQIDLSPDIKKKTGIWSIHPLDGGSAGMNALVRFACETIGDKPDKEKIAAISAQMCKEGEITDIRGALWEAAWHMTGEKPERGPKWPQPWENQAWIPPDVDPGYRLNVLYRDLIGFVFAREDDLAAARKFGISQSRFNRLRQMSLDLNKVESTIKVLSKWRMRKTDPLTAALMISRIWG